LFLTLTSVSFVATVCSNNGIRSIVARMCFNNDPALWGWPSVWANHDREIGRHGWAHKAIFARARASRIPKNCTIFCKEVLWKNKVQQESRKRLSATKCVLYVSNRVIKSHIFLFRGHIFVILWRRCMHIFKLSVHKNQTSNNYIKIYFSALVF
jgi:hypothetical protein